MSKTEGHAGKTAKKNTNTAARKAAKKPATKWTAKQEAKAKRYYSAYTPEEKKCADRLAKKNGCAPWEIVAADLAAHKAINTGCAKKPAKGRWPLVANGWRRKSAKLTAIDRKAESEV